MLSKKEKINISRKVRLVGDLHNTQIWEVVNERNNIYTLKRMNSHKVLERRYERINSVEPFLNGDDILNIKRIEEKRKREPISVSLLRLLFTS